MDNEELFADLFAYRFMLLDIYNNESEIIKKLKYKLIELGKDYNELNDILFDFYNHYQINITIEEIRNTRILLLLINNIINNNNNINNNINNNNLNSNLNIITNLISHFINNDADEEEPDENRMTEERIENLPQITIEEELEDTCSICLDTIPIGSSIYRIPCNHKFHINCLRPQLINYNSRCPVCRTNIE